MTQLVNECVNSHSLTQRQSSRYLGKIKEPQSTSSRSHGGKGSRVNDPSQWSLPSAPKQSSENMQGEPNISVAIAFGGLGFGKTGSTSYYSSSNSEAKLHRMRAPQMKSEAQSRTKLICRYIAVFDLLFHPYPAWKVPWKLQRSTQTNVKYLDKQSRILQR